MTGPDALLAPSVPGYDQLTPVGRGGFATVYRAHEIAFNREVAIKVIETTGLDDEARQRFERECRAVGSLSGHPGIVTVFATGSTSAGQPYLVMEFMTQGSLATRVKASGPLKPRMVAEVGLDLLDAIGAAHNIGIVHRDIKPDNILISRFGRAQLADFGISSIPGGYETRSGTAAQTVAFAAPEVIDGDRATQASDLYSLAATMASLLMGRPVFSRTGENSLVSYIARIVREPAPDLTAHGASPELDAVIRRGMAKSPDERFPSASEFRFALARVPDLRNLEASEQDTLLRSDIAGMVGPMPGMPGMPGSTPAAPVPLAAPDPGPVVAPAPVAPMPTLAPTPAPPVEVAPIEVAPVEAEPEEEAEQTIRRPVVVSPAAAPAAAVPAPAAPPAQPFAKRRAATASDKRSPLLWAIPAAAVVLIGGGAAAAAALGHGSAQPTSAPTKHASTAAHAASPASLATTCQGLTCTFSATGTATAYLWRFGDGVSQAGGATAQHTYAKPGTFSATASADGTVSAPSSVVIASYARSAQLTGATMTVTSTVTADPACGRSTFVLQRQGTGWSKVKALRLASGTSITPVAAAGTYRLVAPPSAVQGGVCAAVSSTPVTVSAPVVSHAITHVQPPTHAPAPPSHSGVKQYNAVHP